MKISQVLKKMESPGSFSPNKFVAMSSKLFSLNCSGRDNVCNKKLSELTEAAMKKEKLEVRFYCSLQCGEF